MSDESQYLVISGFRRDSIKTERHINSLKNDNRKIDLVSVDDFPLTARSTLKPISLIYLLYKSLRLASANDYRKIISFSLIPYGLFNLLLGKITNKPTHLGIIGADIDIHLKSWYSPVIRFLLKKFNTISVPERSQCKELQHRGINNRKIFKLRNGIDVDEYPIKNLGNSEYDFIWVGRMSSEKRPIMFLRAINSMKPNQNMNAVMVGDGPEFEEVKKFVYDHNLDEHVELIGWSDEPVKFYQQSDYYISTSNREALPFTLVEAMSCGLIPIVPDIGGISDLVDDNSSGYIYTPDDFEELTRLMRLVLSNEETANQVGARGAVRIRQEYTLENVRDDWKKILNGNV